MSGARSVSSISRSSGARLPGLLASFVLSVLFGLWLGDAVAVRWLGDSAGLAAVLLRGSTVVVAVLAGSAVALRLARPDAREAPAAVEGSAAGLDATGTRVLSEFILANAADGVVVWDARGRITYASPSAERLFGRRADDLVGEPLSRLVGGNEPGPTALAAGLRAGAILELEGLRRDGSRFPLELVATPASSGGAEAHIGVFRDVSERVRAEHAIRRSESVRDLIDHVEEAVVVHRSGRILYANRAASELLGYGKPEELVGASILEHVVPDERPLVVARMNELQRTQRPLPPVEEHVHRLDGSIASLEVTGVPIVFDGEPASVKLARDLGQQRALLSRVALADRLTSVGTLAAGVAHGINNPLTYVIANLAYSLDEIDALAPEAVRHAVQLGEVRHALDQAREGAERIRDLVRDLATFAGREVTERVPVDLPSVLESALQLASNEIRHRAHVVRDFARVPQVAGDAAHLAHAFLNLLLNAAEAIPEGDAENAAIHVSTQTDERGRAVVEIRDSGCGIPPERQARVFEPFFTTKPVGTGTGLGLSIARGIVTSLGGSIALESAVGSGTRVRVALPPAAVEASPSADAAADTREAPAARARLLVVDDEPAVRSLLRRLLRKDFEIEEASGGLEALQRIRDGERFDAILCDLLMPRMTGMDLYEQLAGSDRELARRMIFLTGGAFTPRARAFLAQVPNPRLEKPMRRDDLRSVLDALLRR